MSALSELNEVAHRVEEVEDDLLAAVRKARKAGASWTEVAEALGVTRQSAWERWAPKVRAPVVNGHGH
jgi:transcriptional regulator with PAS, ATPase and Fis domain